MVYSNRPVKGRGKNARRDTHVIIVNCGGVISQFNGNDL